MIDDPTTGTGPAPLNGAKAEPDHDAILRANGFVALQARLHSVADAVASQLPPVRAIEAAIAFFEETRESATEPLTPDQVDDLDVQLATFRMLHTAAVELEQIQRRADARGELRRGTVAVPPPKRRG